MNILVKIWMTNSFWRICIDTVVYKNSRIYMQIFLAVLILFPLLWSCSSTSYRGDRGAVPELLNPVEDRPYMVAWVDGQALRLAIDTGASHESILFEHVVKALHGRVLGKESLLTTNLKAYLCDGSNVSAIKDGVKDDRQVVVEAPGADFEGLVGWPLMKNYIWNINSTKGTQKFADSVPFFVRNRPHLTIQTRENLPFLRDDAGHRILLDTGAPFAIYLDKEHWDTWKSQNPYVFVTLYSGYSPAAGGYYVHECARARSYTIGGVDFKNIVIAESFIDEKIMNFDKKINIILGLQAFSQRDVWVDGLAEKIYFGGIYTDAKSRQPLNLVGAAFIPAANNMLDAVVLKNSVAWEAGLRSGDTLIYINGQRRPNADLLDYLTKESGAKAVALVMRHGKFKRITWWVPTERSVQPVPPPVTPSLNEGSQEGLPLQILPSPAGSPLLVPQDSATTTGSIPVVLPAPALTAFFPFSPALALQDVQSFLDN